MRSTTTGPLAVVGGGTVRRSYRSRPPSLVGGSPGVAQEEKAVPTCYGCRLHRWADRLAAGPLSSTTKDRHVANIQSQIKRNRQNEKRRLRNKSVRAEMRTRTKSAVAAAEAGAEDSCRGAAPGREAHRQGCRARHHPQEHGGQPQVPVGAADQRDRGGRETIRARRLHRRSPLGYPSPLSVSPRTAWPPDAAAGRPVPARATRSSSWSASASWSGPRRRCADPRGPPSGRRRTDPGAERECLRSGARSAARAAGTTASSSTHRR